MDDPQFECPGSKFIKKPYPTFIKCKRCGADVEIWTDEPKAECDKCGCVNMKEADKSCLDWCKYAKECVGEEAYNKHMASKKKKGDK